MIVLILLQEQQTLTPGSSIVDQLKGNWVVLQLWACEACLSSSFSDYTVPILPVCLSRSNYTALVGVWIYGFFVMVLLALDFLYYSAINYELCRVYLEKWGLGGRWLKKARSQWHRSMPEESEAQAQAQPMVPSHYQPRHSLRGESHSPTLLPYNTSTAWWVAVCHMTTANLFIIHVN